MDITSRIRNIIAEECFLKPESISDDAPFTELGVDSLASIQIWMRIGQELEVEIPDQDSEFWAQNISACLQDMVAIVRRLRSPAGEREAVAAGSAA